MGHGRRVPPLRGFETALARLPQPPWGGSRRLDQGDRGPAVSIPSRRSTWARRAGGSSSAGSGRTSSRSRPSPGSPTARSSGRTGCTGTSRRCSTTAWPACGRRGRWRASAWTPGPSTTGCSAAGELLDLPWCYRDGRTAAGVEAVHARIGPEELYRRTGLQFLPVQHDLPARGRAAAGRGGAAAARPRPGDVLADRPGRLRADQRVHHRPARRAHAATGTPSCWRWSGLDPAQLAELVDPGTVVGDATDGHAGGHGRLARHRLGGGRRPDDRAGRGVRLLRHLGAGRRRARPAGGHRGGARRQLHQRGRRRRPGPVPHQRDGHLAAVGDAADCGVPTTWRRCSSRRRRTTDRRWCSTCRTRGSSRPGDMPARIAAWCREHDVPAPDGRVALVRSIVASLAEGFADGGRAGRRRCPAATYAGCTWSAAAPRTPCSAGCSPTGSGCRCWPARSRRPRSATCWCRVARTGPCRALSKTCGRWSPAPSRIVVHEPTGAAR